MKAKTARRPTRPTFSTETRKLPERIPALPAPSTLARHKQADAAPSEFPSYAYTQGVPPPDVMDDLSLAYTSHVWAYCGIWAIATNLAGLPIMPYKKMGKDGKYQPDETNVFWQLLKKPNQWMALNALKELTFISMECEGSAYWLLVRALGPKRPPTDIWPLHPTKMTIVPALNAPVDHYLYEVNGKKIRYEVDDIIHFRYMNPRNQLYGLGSIGPAKQAIAADLWAVAWNKHFFSNFGRPDSVLKTDRLLTPDVRKRVLEAWKQRYEGVEKRGLIAILEEGLDYIETNRTPQDMDFVNLRKMSREEILGALGVPPAIVGIYEFANYANSREQRRIFWENTLLPKARAFADTLTLRVPQILGAKDDATTWDYDVKGIEALRVDQRQLAQTAKIYIDAGFPPNDVAKALDLPVEPFTGGDVSRPVAGGTGDTGGGDMSSRNNAFRGRDKAIDYETRSARRDTKWRVFQIAHEKHEKAMQTGVSAFMRGQQRRVKAALSEHGQRLLAGRIEKRSKSQNPVDVDILFNDASESRQLRDATVKYIKGAYQDFAMRVGKSIDPEFDFHLADPRAIAFIQGKTLKLSQDVNAWTKEQISNAVQDAIEEAVREGYDQGETIQQIADRLDAIYDFAATGRAERIARTETIGAANAGAEEGMRQTGAESKEWLSSRDEKVRDTHAELDSQVVPVGQPFLTGTGAKLDFPGDPNGPVEEIINCRCTLIPAGTGEE